MADAVKPRMASGRRRREPLPLVIEQDSQSAWATLSEIGGLELEDRDADLEEALRSLLSPDAPDFVTALAGASTDDLVAALLDAMTPFAAMFKDILAYFRRAGAHEGARQWNVAIARSVPRLTDFERFLETWGAVTVDIELPVIGWRAKHGLIEAIRDRAPDLELQAAVRRPDGPPDNWFGKPTGRPKVDAWLASYQAGDFPALPEDVAPSHYPAALSATAMLCALTSEKIRARWSNRKALMDEYLDPITHGRALGFSDEDALHIGTIAQDETDYWLSACVTMLARLRDADPGLVSRTCAQLETVYAGLPLRKFVFETQAKRLQRLLSLPVWRKRHELYAVWVCTEIIEALADHEVALISENRRLPFAFRTTRLAEILTARPPMTLFAERRVRLADPVGKKRTGNVQPDYSIWSNGRNDEHCQLVVEVKHYKRAKQRDFDAVLIDYARAHPFAEVLLVNYGRLNEELDLGDAALQVRCKQIGELNSVNLEARRLFRQSVVAAVGPRKWRRCLAIDVSETMGALLQISPMTAFDGWMALTGIGSPTFDAKRVLLVDNKIRADISRIGAIHAIKNFAMSQKRDLIAIVETLKGQAQEIVILTNREGAADLLELPEQTACRLFGIGDLWAVCIPERPGPIGSPPLPPATIDQPPESAVG